MRKILILVTLLFIATAFASAQDKEFPKFELAGTANMVVADVDVLQDETMWGYGIAGQYNAKSYFGIVGEWTTAHGESGPFSFQRPGSVVIVPKLDTRIQTLLFGPRFSVRTKPVTVFGHFLLGTATNKLDDDIGTFDYNSYTKWKFAFALGGGIDINVGRRFAIRAGQFDYLFMNSELEHLTNVTGPDSFHSFRYQFGGVVKF